MTAYDDFLLELKKDKKCYVSTLNNDIFGIIKLYLKVIKIYAIRNNNERIELYKSNGEKLVDIFGLHKINSAYIVVSSSKGNSGAHFQTNLTYNGRWTDGIIVKNLPRNKGTNLSWANLDTVKVNDQWYRWDGLDWIPCNIIAPTQHIGCRQIGLHYTLSNSKIKVTVPFKATYYWLFNESFRVIGYLGELNRILIRSGNKIYMSANPDSPYRDIWQEYFFPHSLNKLIQNSDAICSFDIPYVYDHF